MLHCKICAKSVTKIFQAQLLGKHTVNYFYCSWCEFLCTEEPYWLDEAYANAITEADIGLLSRNNRHVEIISTLLFKFWQTKITCLDYAGGYGVFTRGMRDVGFDFYWTDPYAQNLFAKNFTIKEAPTKKFDVITSFESFEHFANPWDEITNILTHSSSIIFSTNLLPHPIPQPNDWWYYTLHTGQHISFYSYKTLEYIATKIGLNFYTYGGLHIFTEKILHQKQIEFSINWSRFYFQLWVRYKNKSLLQTDSTLITNAIIKQQKISL